MKEFIEELAREDDRLFSKMPWVVGVSAGLFLVLAAYAFFQLYFLGGLPASFYKSTNAIALFMRTIDATFVGLFALALYLFPRYIPLGLLCISVAFISFLF